MDMFTLGVCAPAQTGAVLCTSHLKPPGPPLGHDRGIAGTFTSYSLHFRPPVDGEYARNHGLRLPDRGISGAVTPWSAVFIFMPHSNFAYIIISSLIDRSK